MISSDLLNALDVIVRQRGATSVTFLNSHPGAQLPTHYPNTCKVCSKYKLSSNNYATTTTIVIQHCSVIEQHQPITNQSTITCISPHCVFSLHNSDIAQFIVLGSCEHKMIWMTRSCGHNSRTTVR